MKYPVYIPEITKTEKKYVNECLDTTWISSKGKFVSLFEKMVQDYIGVNYAVSVFNGTVALHLALKVLGIKEGDEVILPNFTYIASTNSVLYVNAIPVLVDICPRTWNITLDEIKKHVTSKTKAILLTDIYGTPPEMDEIMEFAKKNNIFVIADSAESLGGSYKNIKTGNIADISIFSFFGNKTITTGEGGMITTNNKEFDSLLRKLKNQGNHETIRYYHDVLGYNYRMTNIQAAIGCAQMERIESILERKQNIYDWYFDKLNSYVEFQEVKSYVKSSNWMVSFLLPKGIEREKLMDFLLKNEIETRPFFFPIDKMPFYKESTKTPISIDVSKRGINVPSFPQLTKNDVDYISNKIIEYIANE